ncbi:post-GPI attachment to proteins factor 2-like [Sycon ciliatum]|uniref:post-GPI attachment to proteins factor 2-like n=1 Tax=Sycon ciliatum TaxID=27933 RepID=UPI0020ABA7D5|eukprot:scpid90097/ scgid28847/ Post-GPI attachment to proteins factor 2
MAARSDNHVLLCVSHKKMIYTNFACVVVGTILMILASLYYSFDTVTGTHCRVPNFLPTISAAARDIPSRLIWQLIIIFHIPRGLLEVVVYHNYFSARLADMNWHSSLMRMLNYVQSVTLATHHLSLLSLTLVTSAPPYYYIHEASFITFIVTSFVHMLMLLTIMKLTDSDGRGLKTKSVRVRYFFIHAILFVLSMGLFFRHNAYCEPYVYSYYAGMEYLVIFSNMMFYIFITRDFPDLKLVMVGSGHKRD